MNKISKSEKIKMTLARNKAIKLFEDKLKLVAQKIADKAIDRNYKKKETKYNKEIEKLKNEKIKYERENLKIREDIKQNKKLLKNINNVQISATTQKHADIRREENLKKIANQPNIIKENLRVHRALNNSYKDVIIDDIKNLKQLENYMVRQVTNEFYLKEKNKNLSANVVIEYLMADNENEGQHLKFYFHSRIAQNITSPGMIKGWAEKEVPDYVTEYENLCKKSSLFYVGIDTVKFQFSRTNKTKAGTYIDLSERLKNKKACVNIKNKDNKCLIWCLLAFKHYDDNKDDYHKNEVRYYKKYEKEIKLPDGVEFPINIHEDIPKIEELNNIKINIFEYDEEDDRPNILYNSYERECDNICNLLLISDDEKNHFVWIKTLSRFMRTVDHHSSKTKMNWCTKCLSKAYVNEKDLKEHIECCKNFQTVRCELPTEIKDENKLKFKNFNNIFMHPFNCFMDFEATLEKIEDEKKTNKHVLNSSGIKYNCIDDKYTEEIKIINNSNSEEVIKQTIEHIEKLAVKSYNLLQNYKYNYVLTDEEIKKHRNVVVCEDCKATFTDKNKKVIHHDHVTGKYISSLCRECNLKYQYKPFLPVYLHNLKGYDSHFIVPALNKYGYQEESKINCIPSSEEKYISFNKKIKVAEYLGTDNKIKKVYFEIRFIDTLLFLDESLEKLTNNLKSGCETTKALKKKFENSIQKIFS